MNNGTRRTVARYKNAMRLAISLLLLAGMSAAAAAQSLPSITITAGDTMGLVAGGDSQKLTWSYNAPSTNDAAGKVVIHWFCTPKVAACSDDLARIVTLKESGNVYIVAYINGSQRDAKKMDPIRESEGVGRGTMATGPAVKKLFKALGIGKGPASIVVDVDGKVKVVATSGDINELDSRDTLIKSLVEAIKAYTFSNDGPKTVKVGDKLTFSIKVQLASWLTYSKKSPMEFTLTAPKDLKCDATTLKGDQLKIEARMLTAAVTCTAPKGSYQVRGDIRFGYDNPGGALGLGNEGASWKFEVKP